METNPEINQKAVEILMVEDSAGDALLTAEALNEGTLFHKLNRVKDGVEALEYLRKEGAYSQAVIPDVILLDLNIPRKDGREVLADIKADPGLKHIPVIILTTSKAEEDILKIYNLHANCYVTKPVDLDQFIKVVKTIEEFWLSIVKLPVSR